MVDGEGSRVSTLAARYGWMVATAAAGALAACQPQSQPKSQASAAAGLPQNACMQLTSAPGQPQKFRPVAYEDQNLETCAVHLEGVRLEQKHDVIGVWNGVYIFASATGIDSAEGLNASRYPVFSPDDRSQIDQSLTQQLASQAASSKPASSRP
jgi:hypothetical protein